MYRAGMAFTGIPKSGLAFLAGLREQNDKEWFEAHRAAWDDELLPAMVEACTALHERLRGPMPKLVLQPRVGGNLFRLNRDVRFSKDKKPYETHAALLLWEGAEKFSAPGFFVRVGPTEVVFGGGLETFEEAHLDRYRKLLMNEKSGERLAEALKEAKKAGLTPDGEKLPKAPRGFPEGHPRAELAKHKGMAVSVSKKPGEWLHAVEFLDRAEEAALGYAPLHAWLRDELCRG
jgi:uncharacterized protein (TIGR02453 family)